MGRRKFQAVELGRGLEHCAAVLGLAMELKDVGNRLVCDAEAAGPLSIGGRQIGRQITITLGRCYERLQSRGLGLGLG